MRKYINIIFPFVSFILFTSCVGRKYTYTNPNFTEKEKVMITNNSNYPISIVGNGANLAKVEKQNLLHKKLSDRKQKLKNIEEIRTVEFQNGNEIIASVSNDILFTQNSFDLTPEAKNILHELFTIITDIPNTKVEIVGYTDSTGTDEYNMKLSQLRANSVAIHLHELGIDDKNIIKKGKGAIDPIASNKTASGRKKNRRVEIKLSVQN